MENPIIPVLQYYLYSTKVHIHDFDSDNLRYNSSTPLLITGSIELLEKRGSGA